MENTRLSRVSSFSLARAWRGGRAGSTGVGWNTKRVTHVGETGQGSIVPFPRLCALPGASLCLHNLQMSPLSSSMLSPSLEAKCGAPSRARKQLQGWNVVDPIPAAMHSIPPLGFSCLWEPGAIKRPSGSFSCLLPSGQSVLWALLSGQGCSTNTDPCPNCSLAKIFQSKVQFPLPEICSLQQGLVTVGEVRPKR